MNREGFQNYISKTYNIVPDYPWESNPNYAVYRHKENKKWFALVMDIPKSKLGFCENTIVDIVNLKCDPLLIGPFRKKPGFFPAYHMNKSYWITAILDNNTDENDLKLLVDMSFDKTAYINSQP